jgi:hypothetical protein
MSLTVLPVISFGSGGSDTAASGAGPGTALTGTVGAVTSASATATIGDAVDLSGVAVNGSAVLWIQTASGRQFSRISAISGSSGAWSLTLEDTVWTTSTNKTWGIGGKRATFGNADSRKLFSADVKAGWTVTTDADQSISTALTTGVAGNTTSGAGSIAVKGTTDSPRPVITQTANAAIWTITQPGWAFESLGFKNSNASKGTAYAFDIEGGTGALVIRNCDIGDATNKVQSGFVRGAGNMRLVLVGTTIHDCASHGINEVSGTSDGCLEMVGSKVQKCGATGITLTFPVLGVTIVNSTISGNASEGLVIGATPLRSTIVGNTFHGNGTGGTFSGVRFSSSVPVAATVIANNHFTGNTKYGLELPAGTDGWKPFFDYNNFGTGGLANTSGAVSGITTGAHDLTVDPQYVGATTGDFTPQNAAVQAGFP